MEARAKESGGNSGSNSGGRDGDSSGDINSMGAKKSSNRHDKEYMVSNRYNNNDNCGKDRIGSGDNGRLTGEIPSMKSGGNQGSGNVSSGLGKQTKTHSHFLAAAGESGNEEHRPQPPSHLSLLHQVHAAAASHALLKPSPVGVGLSLHSIPKSDSFPAFVDNGAASIASGTTGNANSPDGACADSCSGNSPFERNSDGQDSHSRTDNAKGMKIFMKVSTDFDHIFLKEIKKRKQEKKGIR